MKQKLPVEDRIIGVVRQLQEAGYETYIVGGAIRDILLQKQPKDYDIATSATPEEVRQVFGRRSVRIIGRRFRLAHLYLGRDIIEISTFRRNPERPLAEAEENEAETEPAGPIQSDNDYGTAQEDAQRRDFTINALFYDPVTAEIIDYTGMGLADVEAGMVRAIGEPAQRFAEDPVRMLRALKLVGQFDFAFDAATENALFESLPLIRQASPSRLSLELEKVLSSSYGDKHLAAFHDYGFLEYFLPFFEARWGTPQMDYALQLFTERNYRVDEGAYRNSISLAAALLALPFVEEAMGCSPGDLWDRRGAQKVIRELLGTLFQPQNMIKSVIASAESVLLLQPQLFAMRKEDFGLTERYGYAHARELLQIQNYVCWKIDSLDDFWPSAGPGRKRQQRHRQSRGSQKNNAPRNNN